MIIRAEIRGNKYTCEQLDEMLSDYLSIGENVFKLRKQKVKNMYNDFIQKYKNKGMSIIKEKYKNQFLNSAKELYKLAEFYLCNKEINYYDKYIYQLNKNFKGARVYLYIKRDKEIGIIYNSVPLFLESWFIMRQAMGVEYGK